MSTRIRNRHKQRPKRLRGRGRRRRANAPVYGVCSRCGCTDHDCSQCVEAQGFACNWVDAGYPLLEVRVMSDVGFFIVYIAGDVGRIADGYRLVYAEIGKRTVRLLDPFTLDTGKLAIATWRAKAPEPYKPRKGVIRGAIKKNLALRERTALVKSCLASMKAAPL